MDPPLPPPPPPQPPQQPAASEPRRYAARFSTSSFLHAPLSVLLDYSSGILRDHAAGGPHHHGAAGGGGGDGEVSIRIVGPAEAAPLEPRAGEAVAVDEGTPATSVAEAPPAGGGSGESLYHRYDVQRVARWVEHALPFSLLLLGVFIRQHLRGFFVAIWIAAVMFKSNDILRKQTALKALKVLYNYNHSGNCRQHHFLVFHSVLVLLQ